MNILVNASNQRSTGGCQVTDSICRNLKDFPQHNFVVVLHPLLKSTQEALKSMKNVTVVMYAVRNNFDTLFLGRDVFLDGLICDYKIDGVLSIFGPTRWDPKCPHLAGFALSQLVIPESPFYKVLSKREYIRQKIRNIIWECYFKRGTKHLYTENPFITERVSKKWKEFEVISITNNYNQIFDEKSRWKTLKLPEFDGCSILTLSRNDKHKNITMTFDVCRLLLEKYPAFKFRFVIPENENNFHVPKDLRNHYVLTDLLPIESVPSLYQQCDVAFQATLTECFTATFPEAMRMDVPLIVCDLEFARGLCGDAALYFPWNDAYAASYLIYSAYTDSGLRSKLFDNAKIQLRKFDNNVERTQKLITALEKLIRTGTIL